MNIHSINISRFCAKQYWPRFYNTSIGLLNCAKYHIEVYSYTIILYILLRRSSDILTNMSMINHYLHDIRHHWKWQFPKYYILRIVHLVTHIVIQYILISIELRRPSSVLINLLQGSALTRIDKNFTIMNVSLSYIYEVKMILEASFAIIA